MKKFTFNTLKTIFIVVFALFYSCSKDSEHIVECDYLISAIGQVVNPSFINLDDNCVLDKWNCVDVNKDTLEASIPGVFAGGDVVTGPFTAISSIAQGKQSALSIMQYLETGETKKINGGFLSFKHNFHLPTKSEFSDVDVIAREKMAELEISDRISTFDEVELGINSEQSINECGRCLECGCAEYYDCTFRKHTENLNLDITNFIGDVQEYKVDERHPFIVLDANKCISCGRCVRTCTDVMNITALGFVNRGFKTIVKPALEKELLETDCITCGNCIDTCPTGALNEKFPYKILGTLPKENYRSICNFCSVGCEINYKKIDDDIYYVSNSTEEIMDTHNKGYLCAKGRFGHRYLMEKNRIYSSSIKKENNLENVSLNEALNYSVTKIKNIIEKYGKDSVAVVTSPKLSNEENYLLQKFARVGLKNNNIFSFSNLSDLKKLSSLDESLGLTVSTTSMNSLNNADVIVVVNSNISKENLVMELKIRDAQKKGAKLISINSSEVKLSKHSDIWVNNKKGTSTLLLDTLMNALINDGNIDEKFIESNTNDFDEFKKSVSKNNINDVLKTCELDKLKFEKLLEVIKDVNKNVVFVYNIDSAEDKSINDLKAIGNFLLLTGRVTKKDNGLIILRDFNNSSGLLDMGATTNYLPGLVKLDEKESIKKISDKWNVNLDAVFKPVNLEERLLNGEIKALLIFGEDPLANEDNRKYFDNVEFLLVSDTFNTETINFADVVLPALSYIEQDGTYTRCDNTVQKVSKIINSPIDYTNCETIQKLASRFADGFDYNSVHDIMNEIKLVNRYYSKVENKKSWTEEFFAKDSADKIFSFANYSIDLSKTRQNKHSIHFPENYFANRIKSKLK